MTNEASVKSGVKLAGFNALRGLAAILVFVFHFWGLARMGDVSLGGVDLTNFFDSGHVGLDMFFALSGFLIFRSIYRNGVNRQYFLRRLLRIAPIYYFSIIVVLIFLTPEGLTTVAGMWDVLSHALFVQSFSIDTYYGINPVLWSLSVEMLFYLFLPLFFLLSGRKGWRILLGICVMLGISYFYRNYMNNFHEVWNSTQRMIYTENFVGRLDQFAWGMLASFLVLKGEGLSVAWRKILNFVSLPLIVIGFVGIYLGMDAFHVYKSSFRDIYFLQMFLHSLIALSASMVMFGFAYASKWFQFLVGNRVVGYAGMISYSFYIWHFVISEQVVKLEVSLLWKFVISFVLISLFSSVTYYLIERPFLKLKKY